jgi:GTP-binding protein EngB required for normal cell division/polyhydroxyalkanoate synthesis regulator phasin
MVMNTKPANPSSEPIAETGDVDGASRLLQLAAIGEELGARPAADDARTLAARVSEGRFYLACIGQFKRGKSTLINALIGEPVLPVGFIPVTAVPTVIRYGAHKKARIQRRDGAWQQVAISELEQYVSEEHNPENAKGVGGAEVFVPSTLLSTGMCLVDTPGLGSVFTGNTAATQAFIPHIDAALVVVGADPPLAGEELALVEAVGRQVHNLILVLNKADRASEAERAAAVRFTRQVLEKRLGRSVPPVFEISAAERLENRGPQRDWGRLLAALETLVKGSGRQLIQAACERGVQRLSEQLLAIITEEREALARPIEESERRIAVTKETIAEAERSMRELDFLWMAEQRHLSDVFVDRHKEFLSSVWPPAEDEFRRAVRSVPRSMGPSYRRAIMREAQKIAQGIVLPWLRTEQEEGEKEYRRVASRFVQMANDFLKKLADAGVRELARMPHALDPETGFRTRSEFLFRDMIDVAQPASPLRWIADLLLGLVGARRVIVRDGREFLGRLLEVNCSRVQNDVLNRVQESRGRLEVEIRKLLHEVSRIAADALNHARQAQCAGAPAVDAALARLDRLEREISELTAEQESCA